MNDRAALLAVLALLAADDAGYKGNEGVLSRVVSKATGAVVEIVDPDAVVERIDVDALLARVDINALLERVDIDRLMARIDMDAIVARVDVKEVAERAGIPDIVRESTGELAGSFVDVLRRQIVSLDAIVGRGAFRLTGRDPASRPIAPSGLEAMATDEEGRGQVTGFYAGSISRLAAFLLDAAIVWFSFVLTVAGFSFIIDLFVSGELTAVQLGPISLVLLALWAFVYLWLSLTIAGRTIGMGLVGIHVVDRAGQDLSGRQAFMRTVFFPVSFLIFGLGFLGIFISPERRALHDATAGSVVVYDWGDRPAEMSAPLTKWVARHVDDLEPLEPE